MEPKTDMEESREIQIFLVGLPRALKVLVDIQMKKTLFTPVI